MVRLTNTNSAISTIDFILFWLYVTLVCIKPCNKIPGTCNRGTISKDRAVNCGLQFNFPKLVELKSDLFGVD